MTDNLGRFEDLVFRIPGLNYLIPAIIILGLIYSVLFSISTNVFSSLTVNLTQFILLSVFGFILPAIIASELFSIYFNNFPRRWSYFLALVNQGIFFVYSLILTGANNFINAWNIFWLSLLTLYLANLFVLLITQGYRKLTGISVLSLTQPLILLLIFHLSIANRVQITMYDYLSGFAIILLGALSFLTIFFLSEYFIRLNVPGLSVVELMEGLIQKKEKALDLGEPVRPEVQTLEIENEQGEASICVPWVHPGPLEGFGGGRLTSKIISALNSTGSGFFFHVPSTHKSDMADPEDYRKILDAMRTPKKTGKASKLIEKTYKNVKFYGRRFGDQKIVYMDADYDDYEVSIFKDVIDLEETLLVDLHNHDRHERGSEVRYGTKEAEELRESFKDFRDDLDELEAKYSYKAGFKIEEKGKPIFALIEEVADKKTALVGIEGNGTSDEVRKFLQGKENQFDNLIFFSTDTHSNIHDYKSAKQVNTQSLDKLIDEAFSSLSEASIGLTRGQSSEINLLKEDYMGLIFSINILIRLIIFSLVLLYFGLVIGVFF